MNKITLKTLQEELPTLPPTVFFEDSPEDCFSTGYFYKLNYNNEHVFIIDRDSGFVLPEIVTAVDRTGKREPIVFRLYTTEGTQGLQKWKYIPENNNV